MTRSSSVGRAAWLAALLAGVASPLAAQSGWHPPGGPIIDTIVIVSHNIFDRQERVLGFMARLADAIHVRTRPLVIRRTLLLNQGDPYDSARAVESERALRALGVFRQVVIDTERVRGLLALRVETFDGWSTKPQVNWSTEGGDVSWVVGMEEDNLVGTATSLSALYSTDVDRSAVSLLYQNPHFIWRRPRLFGLYQDLSDGQRGSWALSMPFYETAAPWALGTGGEAATQRILEFRDGALLDSIERHALRFGVGGGVALHATTRDYLRLWGGASWRREDFAPESTTAVPYSSFGTVGAGIELSHTRYVIMQHFNTYARREDENLSETLRVGLWAAPAAWGYPSGEAGIGAELSGQVTTIWSGGFAVLRGGTDGVLTSSGLDSARIRGGFTIASQNFAAQTIVLHVEGGILRHPKPGGQFDSYLDQTGPRLFAAHAFTGTRTVWVCLEDRVLVSEQVAGLIGVGLAPFFDWGGDWYDARDLVAVQQVLGETPRTGSDVGLAIRLGPTRSVEADVEEIDIGWRFGNGYYGSSLALSIRRAIFF